MSGDKIHLTIVTSSGMRRINPAISSSTRENFIQNHVQYVDFIYKLIVRELTEIIFNWRIASRAENWDQHGPLFPSFHLDRVANVGFVAMNYVESLKNWSAASGIAARKEPSKAINFLISLGDIGAIETLKRFAPLPGDSVASLMQGSVALRPLVDLRKNYSDILRQGSVALVVFSKLYANPGDSFSASALAGGRKASGGARRGADAALTALLAAGLAKKVDRKWTLGDAALQ